QEHERPQAQRVRTAARRHFVAETDVEHGVVQWRLHPLIRWRHLEAPARQRTDSVNEPHERLRFRDRWEDQAQGLRSGDATRESLDLRVHVEHGLLAPEAI